MKLKISQSMIRDFYDSNYCKIKWEETYLNGFRTIPSAAMLDGLVFEQNVIGMSRGGEVYEIPKGKTGKPLKRETDLLALAEKSKEMMNDLEIELIDVQPEWETDELIGHPDALIKYKGELAIMDLKYTAMKEDENCKWNPYAWGNIVDESTGEIYKDFTQAIHYIEMYFQEHGIYLPFFYLIFGKSGWCKFIMIEPSKETIESYRDRLKRFRNDLKNFIPKPIKSYSKCRKCSVLCEKRTLKPEIQQILY
tara:strand:- start:309 stop:1061 length:753 start_codon:yes stop_codon:yes gene_type:complete